MTGTQPVLTAQAVGVHRGAGRGRKQVLHDVDLSVGPGEIVALLGPNGAGKSTLLGALGGVLPLSSGTVARPRSMATVLQSPGLARRSAAANVELAAAWAGVPRGERHGRALEAMRLMRVDHLARRPARMLSGGEQRRVHLARAVAVSPQLLLLDEPFDGLDPQTHETLRTDAADALRSSGGSVVVVLHDRRDAWAIADRVAVLVDGRIEVLDTPQQVLDAPPSAAVARFLGYNGELDEGSTVRLTRTTHVHVDPAGPLVGTVVRRHPTEDGLRLQLHTPRGDVWALHRSLGVRDGDEVRFAVHGGVTFPIDAAAPASPAEHRA